MMDDSNPVNPIIKVYGYHRSGNNYLCALLYRNFYSGLHTTEIEMDTGKRTYYLFGEAQPQHFIHPFFRLFGSHDPRYITKDSIYIFRDYEDVDKSFEKMKHRIVQEYSHHIHAYIALQKGAYIVYYDDLKKQPDLVLREIQIHFRLNRLYKNFITEVGYNGFKE